MRRALQDGSSSDGSGSDSSAGSGSDSDAGGSVSDAEGGAASGEEGGCAALGSGSKVQSVQQLVDFLLTFAAQSAF